jgi:hypothetical protein
MSDPFAALREGILARFGEAVIAAPQGIAAPLEGAWRAPWQGAEIGGVPTDRPQPQLLVRAEDWQALGLGSGATVRRAGTDYTVVDSQPDQAGLLALTLRRYSA